MIKKIKVGLLEENLTIVSCQGTCNFDEYRQNLRRPYNSGPAHPRV